MNTYFYKIISTEKNKNGDIVAASFCVSVNDSIDTFNFLSHTAFKIPISPLTDEAGIILEIKNLVGKDVEGQSDIELNAKKLRENL